jgi:hypothetical protein
MPKSYYRFLESVLIDNSVGWLVTEFVGELSFLYLKALNLIVLNRLKEPIQWTHLKGK